MQQFSQSLNIGTTVFEYFLEQHIHCLVIYPMDKHTHFHVLEIEKKFPLCIIQFILDKKLNMKLHYNFDDYKYFLTHDVMG